MARVLNLAVLLSGSGRTLENLQQAIMAGRLSARVAIVVSSKSEAYGLVRARQYGLDAVAVPRRDYPDPQAFNEAINTILARYPSISWCWLVFYRSMTHRQPWWDAS